MSGFAALMALSASQTRESQSAVQSALEQRERAERLRRKQQEERERKERELEIKLRLKHFEDEKKEQERQARLEHVRHAQEMALQRREDEQREALRYGPKKAKSASAAPVTDGAPKWPASNSHSHSREEVRRRRLPSEEDDDSVGGSPGIVLTREEKRERKLQAEIRRTFQSTKRSSHHSGYGKAGKRLPGGAIDVTTGPTSTDVASSTQSVKARISAIPNTLTKLNTVKRDTRTIDEILQDRAKARDVKVLDGEEARDFNDWFGTTKKKEPARKAAALTNSAPPSGTNTPASPASTALQLKKTSVKPFSSSDSPRSSTQLKLAAPATTTVKSTSATSRTSLEKHNPSQSKLTTSSKASLPITKTKTVSTQSASNSRLNLSSSVRKRPRSASMSESPPPTKKRAQSAVPTDLSNEIWKLFGKDRGQYVQKDVLSDDEDMEADARVLEKEELMSSRIAKKEEDEALEAERRHEEEKRRRKMREKRG